jgi:thiol-disulfide isomerase/thioredoxin
MLFPTRLASFTLLAVSAVSAQSADTPAPDGLAILQQMSEHYAKAGSWYIVATEERTEQTEYSNRWTKTVMVAASSGNRYHYEGHSEFGSALDICDGKTAWSLHPDEHAYTQEPAPATGYQSPKVIEMNEGAAWQAVNLSKQLAGFSKHYSSADRLPDAVLFQDGIAIPSYVVHVSAAQSKGPKSETYSLEATLWIDKTTWAVRKTVAHENTFLGLGGARIPLVQDTVTTYQTAQFNTAVPEAVFQFVPPQDAKLVAKFPDTPGANLTGETAPEVQLVAADGRKVPLSSYRGEPVLLDFWATWCAPCRASLPRLAKLQQEAAPKGLVMLSVDEDEEAKTANDFLAKNHYTWPNTQDDGKIGDAFNKGGIPLVVLIDAQGKIVLYQNGDYGNDDALRKALAGLGPQFAGLETAQQPCQTASR